MHYTGYLTKKTYRTKRIIDYVIGDWYWYHDKKIPTGYVYNKVSMRNFKMTFDNDGKLHGKLSDVLLALKGKFKSMGKIVKENNGAFVVTTKAGHTAFAYLEEKKVVLLFGNLGDANSLVIDKYKDATEDGEDSDVSYGYLNNLFPDEQVVDTAAVYTALIDNATVY